LVEHLKDVSTQPIPTALFIFLLAQRKRRPARQRQRRARAFPQLPIFRRVKKKAAEAAFCSTALSQACLPCARVARW